MLSPQDGLGFVPFKGSRLIGVVVFFDPLVELVLQSILLLSVFTSGEKVHDLFGIILKIVELFAPICIEIVFPLGCSMDRMGFTQVCLP